MEYQRIIDIEDSLLFHVCNNANELKAQTIIAGCGFGHIKSKKYKLSIQHHLIVEIQNSFQISLETYYGPLVLVKEIASFYELLMGQFSSNILFGPLSSKSFLNLCV